MFSAQFTITECNTGEVGESIECKWEKSGSGDLEIKNRMEEVLQILRETPQPPIPPFFGTVQTSTGGRHHVQPDPFLEVEVRVFSFSEVPCVSW